MTPTPLLSSLASLAAAAALGACAVAPTAPSVLVLPGTQKTAAQFQADNLECQQYAQALLAPDAQAANNQAVASAAIGTAIGAAAGALLGQGAYHDHSAAWGAGTGLMIGSSVGSGNSQFSSYGLQQRFDIAYMQCMYLRGNQVPGQVAYRNRAPAGPPPPPAGRAPSFPPPNTPPPIGVAPPS